MEMLISVRNLKLHNNAFIYVAGNTFIGNPPIKSSEFKKEPSYSKKNKDKDCKKPNDLPKPYDPSSSRYHWQLQSELNPDYK